uniref:Uncharacterized protein n=1 Tax=Romanomermis culicivorax TaxID=13658 RepID=A0A915KQL6_ROMCU
MNNVEKEKVQIRALWMDKLKTKTVCFDIHARAKETFPIRRVYFRSYKNQLFDYINGHDDSDTTIFFDIVLENENPKIFRALRARLGNK